MTASLAASDLLRAAISFATSLVIARGLGRDGFGQWTLCMTGVGALTGALDLGTGMLLTREAALGGVGALVSAALVVRAALFAPIGALLVALSPAIARGAVSPQAVRDGALFVAAGAAYGCFAAVFRARPERLLALVAIDATAAVVRLAGAMLLVGRGAALPDLLRLAAAVQVGQAAAAYGVWRILAPDDDLARPSIRRVVDLVRGGLPFALAGLVANAQSRVAPLLLGYASTAGQLAFFGVAARIGRAARMLPQAALSAGMPIFAGEQRAADASSTRRRVDRIMNGFGVAAAAAVVVAAGPLVNWTYGAAFAGASAAVVWTGIALVPWLANNARKMHLYAAGRERVAVRWSAAALLLQAAACVLLIPRFGAAGAAAALAIGEAAVWMPLRGEDEAGAREMPAPSMQLVS